MSKTSRGEEKVIRNSRFSCVDLNSLQQRVVECRLCPRLVEWREQVAREKVKRFMDWEYWGKPLPSFGDPRARLLIFGLAPAAHGGNRTGRMFTGDMSGDFLYRTLHKTGFANQSESIKRDDGLKLRDCYITAMVRCAPPANRPTPEEVRNCHQYLACEFALLKRVKVVVALGRLAFDAALRTVFSAENAKHSIEGGRPKFGHGAEYKLNEGLVLLASFHPSQQNTFTGKLTEAMLDEVFERAREIIRG